jgi:uncharacterized protein
VFDASMPDRLGNLAAMTSGMTGSRENGPDGSSVPAMGDPTSDGEHRAGTSSETSHDVASSSSVPASPATSVPGVPAVPATARDAGMWLAFGGVGYVFGQVMSAVLLVAAAAVVGHLSDISQLAARSVPPAWVVVTGLIGLWMGFLGAVFLASYARGTGDVKRDMGLSFRPWDAVVGPATGLVGQLLLLPLLYLPLEHAVPNLNGRLSQSTKHLTGGFPGADLVVIAVLTVLVVPVIEELLFRGLVLRACLRLFQRTGRVLGPLLSMVCSGVVFGLAHAELLQLLGLAAFGVVLAALAWRTGRLGPSIFAHATFNLLAIVSVATTGALR